MKTKREGGEKERQKDIEQKQSGYNENGKRTEGGSRKEVINTNQDSENISFLTSRAEIITAVLL